MVIPSADAVHTTCGTESKISCASANSRPAEDGDPSSEKRETDGNL